MGLTSLLCLALMTGLAAFVLESVSIATDNWAFAAQGDFEEFLRPNITDTVAELGTVPQEEVIPPTSTRSALNSLLKNKGFWSYCEYMYFTDEMLELRNLSGTSQSNLNQVQVQGQSGTGHVFVECKAVNFTGGEEVIPEPDASVSAYWSAIFFLDRAASGFACICVGLQLCAVLTSFQAAYTTLPVLFTDCGVMFLFGAFFQLVCMVLFMISMSVGILERPRLLIFPNDYKLEYSWSFYMGWGSFILGLVTGIAYLLLARAWETEEVWLKPMGKEKKSPAL